jgi:hypothetical protein
MALALQDELFRSRRLSAFLRGAGARHAFMVHIGAGWAYARLPWIRIETNIRQFDPILRWLPVDGFGFCRGYFEGVHFIEMAIPPKGVSNDGLSAFDNGLGRAMWFYECGDIAEIQRRVVRFPVERRADLWAGVGLACAYAGGVPRDDIKHLASIAEPIEAAAQGAAFAAKARQYAGNPAGRTAMACETLCGMSADEAAALVDTTLADTLNGIAPSYIQWRRNLQRRFATLAIS